MSQIRYFVRRTFKDLTDPIFLKQMAWVLALWPVTLGIILFNIRQLRNNYPDPARPPDLFHDLLPKSDSFVALGDLCGAVGAAIIIYVMWQWHFKKVPKLMFMLGVMYIIRSFAINLTPLAQIRPPAQYYPETHIIAQNFYYGMFFSGHAASAFIQVFLIKGHPLRPVAAALAAVQAVTLLASHSHYSIDIFGGIFVAYFVTHFDWMRLVPHSLRKVRWMPWYTGGSVPEDEEQAQPVYTTRR